MLNDKYELRYLPLFYSDMQEKIDYISEVLQNPQAAMDLISKVEVAILERVPVAESFEPYMSAKERKYPYYRIYVDNFVVYYVVIHAESEIPIMEVRRFLYMRQNQKNKI